MAQAIYYHGTDKATSDRIRKEGFKPDTWFAKHLEDAVGYGGVYVFEVEFPEALLDADSWQFQTRKQVPPSRIVALTYYAKKPIIKNELLRAQIQKSNMTPRAIKRLTKDIKAHPERYTRVEREVFK